MTNPYAKFDSATPEAANPYAKFDTGPEADNPYAKFDAAPVAAKPADAFTSTLKATGAHMLNSALGQPVEDIGSATGIQGVQKFGKGVREYAEGVQRDNPSQINSLSDIAAHPIEAVKTALGNVVPQLPVSMAGAYAGAQLGALTSPVTGPVGPIVGGVLGMALPSYLQEYTEMRGKQHETGQEDIPKALAYAVPAAASDVVLDKFLLKGSKFLPAPLRGAADAALAPGASRIAHVAKQGAKGFGAESAQEYGQTVLEQLGGNQDTSTQQAADERNVSGALGGIGGGAIKGGTSVFDARTAGPLARAANQGADQQAAEQARLQAEAQQAQLPVEPEAETNEQTDTPAVTGGLTTEDSNAARSNDQVITGTVIGTGEKSAARSGEPATGAGFETDRPATRMPPTLDTAATGDTETSVLASPLEDAESILPDNEDLTNPPQPTGVDQNVTNQETSESTDEKNANADAEEKRLLDAEAGAKLVNAELLPKSEVSGLAGVETPVVVDAQAKSAPNETGDSLLQPAAEKSGGVLDPKAQKLVEYEDGINAADAQVQALVDAKQEPGLTLAQKLEIKDQLHSALAKSRDLTNLHTALAGEIAGQPSALGVDEVLAARKQQTQPITEETNDGRLRGISDNIDTDYGSQHGQEQTPGQVDSRVAGDLAAAEPVNGTHSVPYKVETVNEPVTVGQQKDATQPTQGGILNGQKDATQPTQDEVLDDRTITDASATGGAKTETAVDDAGNAPASAGEAVSESNGGQEPAALILNEKTQKPLSYVSEAAANSAIASKKVKTGNATHSEQMPDGRWGVVAKEAAAETGGNDSDVQAKRERVQSANAKLAPGESIDQSGGTNNGADESRSETVAVDGLSDSSFPKRKLTEKTKFTISTDKTTAYIYARSTTTGKFTRAFITNPASLDTIKKNGINDSTYHLLSVYKEQPTTNENKNVKSQNPATPDQEDQKNQGEKEQEVVPAAAPKAEDFSTPGEYHAAKLQWVTANKEARQEGLDKAKKLSDLNAEVKKAEAALAVANKKGEKAFTSAQAKIDAKNIIAKEQKRDALIAERDIIAGNSTRNQGQKEQEVKNDVTKEDKTVAEAQSTAPGADTHTGGAVAQGDAQKAGVAGEVAGGEVAPKESEHAGYKIYPTSIKGKDYFTVQNPDNKAKEKTGFGDTLHDTLEHAHKQAEQNAKQAAWDLERKQAIEAEHEKEQVVKSERDDMDGFGESLSPMQKGKAVSALNKKIRIEDGRVVTVKELVREQVAKGEVASSYEEDAVKPMTRVQSNRADQRQQDDHAKRVKEGGKKTVYQVSGYELGKIAHDYAKHLTAQTDTKLAKTGDDVGQQKDATQPTGASTAKAIIEVVKAHSEAQNKRYETVESEAKPTVGKGGSLHAPHDGFEWIDGKTYLGGQFLPNEDSIPEWRKTSKTAITTTPEIAAHLNKELHESNVIVTLGAAFDRGGEKLQKVYIESTQGLHKNLEGVVPNGARVLMTEGDAEAKGLKLGATWKYSYKKSMNSAIKYDTDVVGDSSLDKQMVGYYYPDNVVRETGDAEVAGADVGQQKDATQPTGAKASITDPPANLDTFANANEARLHLVKAFGPGVNNLVDKGVLHFTVGKASWPEAVKKSKGYTGGEEAVYINGEAYIDLLATPKERMIPVLLHEIGEHHNLRKILGTKGYEDLQKHIANLAKVQGSKAEEVWNKVKRVYDLEEGGEDFVSEVIAKLGEVDSKAVWYKRLLSQIKAFLMKHGLARGFLTGTLSENDMHAVLVASLHSAARGRVRDEARFYGEAMASVPAWHGSPHDHDKFDSGKIGTGEGAQAFGYGHYFTDKKEIAEWYKKNLSDAVILDKGKEIDNANEIKGSRTIINGLQDGLSKERILEKLQGYIDRIESSGSTFEINVDLKSWKDTYSKFDNGEYTLKNTGKLYNVELAPEQDEFLDWDRPLIEQSEKVKAVLKAAYIARGMPLDNSGVPTAFESNPTGNSLYASVSGIKGAKFGSDFLHSFGIRGIRYKAEAGKSEANNYVIFSDDDVSITAKFSRTPETQAASEKRIKALFEGTDPERVHGVKILDKSDIFDMLGLSDKNVLVAEAHGVVRGRTEHAGFSEADWNKVPYWIDNAIAVFKQEDKDYRFIGPELIDGKPVVIAVMPQAQSREDRSTKVSVLKTAFAKDDPTKRMPIAKWLIDGDLVYADTTKTAQFNKDTGYKLPTAYRDLVAIKQKVVERNKIAAKNKKPLLEVVDIKSDRDFAKYKEEERKSPASVETVGTTHPTSASEQQNSNSNIPQDGGKVKFSRTDDAYTEDTITIDGKERPATNSNGQRIAQTEEGMRNFWKWFGDSKVVDGEGRPLVVYHGTQYDFTEFDKKKAHDKEGKSINLGWGKGVFYFSPEHQGATAFARRKNRGKAYVEGSPFNMHVYLKLNNPFDAEKNYGAWQRARDGGVSYGVFFGDIPAKNSNRAETFVKLLKKEGFDGIIGTGEITAFNPNQIKSAIGNNGDFSSKSNDIRFSRTEDAGQESLQDRAQGVKKAVKSRMRTLGDLLSKQGNAFLSVLQMQEQNEATLPGIAVYADSMHARRTVIDTTLQAADRILKKWRLLSKGVNGKLAETMHASTLADVDATRDWSGVTQTVSMGNRAGDKGIVYKAHTQAKLMPKRRAALMAQAEAINNRDANPLRSDLYSATDALFRTEAGAQEYLALLDAAEKAQTSYRAGKYQDENISRKVEHAKVLTGFAELPAPARDVYRETHALHTQLANEKLDVLTERVSESIFNGEKRAALNALIRLKFESNKLDFYYAPLARFGDQWYYGKNAEGKPVFETFGNTADRDEAAKAFEKAGGTDIEAGTSIKDLANIKRDGGSDSFVTDVIKLIDQSGIDSEQSKALQDEIYQMYLSTLPEVSLRHSSQHRKGTLGFEKDAMKAFANAMHHSASQLANMKEGRQMEQALDELGAVHAMSQSSAKREEGQRDIDAAQMLLADWEELSQDGALDELLAQAEDDAPVKLLKTAKGLLKKFGVSDEHDAASALENHSEIMAKRIAQSKLLDTPEVRAKAANVIAELLKNYAALTHTETGAMDRVAAYARQFGFIYMLGFGISSGAVNLLQTPIVAMPVVQARYGIASTASAFRKAYADFGEAVTLAFHKDAQGNYDSRDSDGNASISEVLKKRLAGVAPESPEGKRLRAEITMLKNRKDDGTISRTQTHDVINVGKEGEEYGGPLLELSKKMGWMFHHGERLNREVTLLAAFRASLDGNRELKDGKTAYLTALEQAEDYARKLTNDTHFEYSPENAARIFRGWPAGIALQFKKYSQASFYLWGKNVKASLKDWEHMPYGTETEKAARDAAQQKAEEAKRALAGLFVMQVAVSGAFGLPLTGAMAVMMDFFANLFDGDDDDDKKYDIRKNARVWLTEHFGETLATAVTKGFVNAATPLNLADRTELANVLFRDNLQDLEGKDQMTNWLASLFGPTGGIARDLWTGLGFAQDGEFERALESVLPKFARDVMQAGRFAAEDARSLNGVKLKDMSAAEVAQKALGFGGSRLEEKYFYRGAEKEDEASIRDAREKLLHKAAQAVLSKEPVPWDDIKDWKRKHPGAAIEKANIMASVRTSRSNEKKRGDKGYYVNPKILLEGEDE